MRLPVTEELRELLNLIKLATLRNVKMNSKSKCFYSHQMH
jgi:hypothetical protein